MIPVAGIAGTGPVAPSVQMKPAAQGPPVPSLGCGVEAPPEQK